MVSMRGDPGEEPALEADFYVKAAGTTFYKKMHAILQRQTGGEMGFDLTLTDSKGKQISTEVRAPFIRACALPLVLGRAPSSTKLIALVAQALAVDVTSARNYEFDITTPGDVYHLRSLTRKEMEEWTSQLERLPPVQENELNSPRHASFGSRTAKRNAAAAALKTSVHETAAEL
tara:strand:+ start:2048 stop:2572 length:525 start_codon:yes stop_codon:yes gene_type:complete